MRGEFNDFNPWQVPMGSITEPVLKHCGFQVYRVEQEDDVEPVTDAACRMAFGGGNLQTAVLLSQRMTDTQQAEGSLRWTEGSLSRAFWRDRGDLMVVTGIGSSTYDVARLRRPRVELLHLERARLHADGRSRLALGAADAPRRGDHRRRRRVDGARQPRHHRGQAAEEPVDRLPRHTAITAPGGMQPSATSAGVDLGDAARRLQAQGRSCR